MRKPLYILFYLATAFAAVSVLAGMARPDGPPPGGGDRELEEYALDFYRSMDSGDFDRIVSIAVEGRWRKGDKPREYHFAGLQTAPELRQHLLTDYGKDGWMIRFVSLRAVDSTRLAGKAELLPAEKREAEIVGYLESLAGKPLPVSIVVLEGHVSGRCNIINWRRRVPIVEMDGRRVVISRGTPDDYEPVRREQWFKAIGF